MRMATETGIRVKGGVESRTDGVWGLKQSGSLWGRGVLVAGQGTRGPCAPALILFGFLKKSVLTRNLTSAPNLFLSIM